MSNNSVQLYKKDKMTDDRKNSLLPDRDEQKIMEHWGNSSPPLVSICCITYNHESYLRDTVNSFLMQETEFPFEIIIHDDASLDGTPDIIKQYCEKYPGIIRMILQKENQYSKGGLIYQRFVFPLARGKYIALCEGDDYWTDKTKLQKQVAFLETNPDYVITYTDCRPFDESGVLDVDYRGARRDLDSIELQQATPIFTLTTCFRNLLREVPQDLMSARFGDLVMWSQLGHFGKGKYMPEIEPSAYRVHGGGVHSPKSIKEKVTMALITRSALFAYYQRNRNSVLSRYFFRKMMYSYVKVLYAASVSLLSEIPIIRGIMKINKQREIG